MSRLTAFLEGVATSAERLLLQHPGDRGFPVPRTKLALARELEVAGWVKISQTRTGLISLFLTEAGQERREELRMESIARAEPQASPRAVKAAPTKRAASLDDLLGQGAFKPASNQDRPITLADLEALEERLVARFRQILEETRRR